MPIFRTSKGHKNWGLRNREENYRVRLGRGKRLLVRVIRRFEKLRVRRNLYILISNNHRRAHTSFREYSSRQNLIAVSIKMSLSEWNYLSHINLAGGLYWRILTEVVSTDRGQDSPIQTDQAWLIGCLLYGKQEKFNSFYASGFY